MNKLAPYTPPKDEVLGKWLTPIHGGIVYTGINIEELDADLHMLLSNGVMSESEFIELCDRLEKTKQAVSDLYEHIECLLPHKTNGQCQKLKIGRNRLLSMLLRIMETKHSFIGA